MWGLPGVVGVRWDGVSWKEWLLTESGYTVEERLVRGSPGGGDAGAERAGRESSSREEEGLVRVRRDEPWALDGEESGGPSDGRDVSVLSGPWELRARGDGAPDPAPWL